MHQMGKAQVVNYLKATKYPVGLLINFWRKQLTMKKIHQYKGII